ncbi:MAG: FAD-binding oxidoreductase [Thermodesulfobacteriota bacterium]
MQRWNGWGDEAIEMALPPAAEALLENMVGKAAPPENIDRDEMIARVPEVKIPDPPEEVAELITTAAADRLDHAHGQSMPDWVGMRFGTLSRFPDAVAYPAAESELESVLEYAERHQMIVVAYGGGTSVVGHLDVPDAEAPVLSLSLERLNGLLDLEAENMMATFGAGVRGPDLEAALRARGYTLGHYPQSFDYSSLGGWVVTRSSGQQSLYYGRIEDLFAGGDVITPSGKIDFPPYPASAAGPDLRQVFLGSEGRLGLLTRASVRISPIPEKDDIYGVFFPTWEAAVCAVRELITADLPLSMIRLSNPKETYTNLYLAGHEKQMEWLKAYLRLRGFYDQSYCMMLMGLIGPAKMASAGRGRARRIIKKYGGVSVGKPMGNAWKKNRFRAPYLRNTLWDKGFAVDTLETAITWDRVTPTMHAVEAAIADALTDYGEKVHVFTHLSHVYTTGSSIYTTYVFRIGDSAEQTLTRWRRIKDAASRAIVEAGGTISHQHGVGTDHKPYLPAEKRELGIDMLNGIFDRMDPAQRMNPGKLVD